MSDKFNPKHQTRQATSHGQYSSAHISDAAPDPGASERSIPAVVSKDRWQRQISNRGRGDAIRGSQFHEGRGRSGFQPFRATAQAIMQSANGHLDASESQFYARQLIAMIPEAFKIELKSLNARTIIPVYFGSNPGATHLNWRQTETYGRAQIVSDWGQDIPLAEAAGTEMSTKVESIRTKTQQNIQTLRASAMAGIDLEENEAVAAREVMLAEENRIAWDGDSAFGLGGFLGDAAVPRIPAVGEFASLAPQAMEDEMHRLVNSITEETETEVPDTLGLPTRQYNRAATSRIGTNNTISVLQAFMANSPYIRSVTRIHELSGRGAGGTDAAIAFSRDIRKVRLNVMLDMEVMPPDFRGGVTQTVWHMRTGGVTWHKPLSGKILEGI